MKINRIKGDFMIFPKGKAGWIRIVEAFVAILLIAGILLTVLGNGTIKGTDRSSSIYEFENGLLKEIQLNDNLRDDISNANPLPINWTDMTIKTPALKDKIQFETPSYLTCEAKICLLSDDCTPDTSIEKSIYARSVAVTGEIDNRKLKLFCWEK